MERTHWKAASLIWIAALAPAVAFAGASFAPVEREAPLGPGEAYAESRFGRPPVKVDVGVSTNYAARAVTDLEAPDEELAPTGTGTGTGQGARRPAGLMFGEAQASETAPAVDPALHPVKRPPAPEGATSRKGVQEVALIAGDLGFFPKTVFVSRDVPVRMFVTGASKNTLCIMMDSFQVRRQVRSNKIEEITFTPNLPGKYRFYCPVNGMEGTMIVKEFATNFTADDVNR